MFHTQFINSTTDPMQRMMGTSSTVTGPKSCFTVTSSSVTSVEASKTSSCATLMTLAFSPVSSVVLPTSKSGDGRIGSPRSSRPSVAMNRISRSQFGAMICERKPIAIGNVGSRLLYVPYSCSVADMLSPARRSRQQSGEGKFVVGQHCSEVFNTLFPSHSLQTSSSYLSELVVRLN